MKQNNFGGFTLIELLVVVLIIGILASVALPQYKKAVWRSKNTQLKALVRSVWEAQEEYHLANGEYSSSFEPLSVDLPLTPKDTPFTGYVTCGPTDTTRAGKDFEIILNCNTTASVSTLGMWKEGEYRGRGIVAFPDGNMYCIEPQSDTSHFCAQIEKTATVSHTGGGHNYYLLP
ncbi:type IV pilin protein [Candidatus Avelusimicrobium luingense]|uniref:type IV pilin protein n=1 Tax=Candidatus Avelusimicrobium luingense TaxID=3416211 RepID=UPI003D0F9941